jgi:hypothetical protein
MDGSTVILPRLPSKRPRRHLERFGEQSIAQKIDIIVITLHRDDFVDIEPVPYPVQGLENAY